MKFVITFIGFFLSISVFAQLSWYKCLSGKIDKYPVTIQLYKQAHKYEGYYYYDNVQEPIYLIGEDTSAPGNIKLTAYLPDRETEEDFIFTLNDKKAIGTWTNSSTKKTLSFSATEVTTSPSWDYIFTSGSVKLRPKKKESPEATYEAASVWPQGNSSQAMVLKKLINQWYTKENSTTDIGKIFLKEKKKFFDDYISTNKDVPDSEMQHTYSYNMDNSSSIKIVYQSPKLLTLSNLEYSYTGGAHGNYGTDYLCIDLVNNKKILLNDVITAAGKKQLGKLLEKYFRKEYNLKPGDKLSEGGLFEETIKPNENFFITAKGIGFDYPPYEIGPYAMGEIVIFIPFAELPSFLQPGIKRLL